ncbi:RNA polymerase sigma factor [Natronogracilivirga saccharolytica]|uniref:RNA polymerase sigma-70 factor n=1 Tax=Natronogracilivirga saccharolytica TaxID=2812953 RepID=A0A8J7UUL7_9BACT|nr:RNA polymerase sigma-70 factor [Natronogracilivirga saccharolytica]MBP3192545.1 RNA polymerase sigma-70 factor [Natronogracilivirga saccharolytica]
MTASTQYHEWALRLRNSDESAFREIFTDSYDQLIRYADSIVRDPDAAADILQDVYAHLWEIRDRVDENRSLKALLYRMTRNRGINYLRMHRSVRLDELGPADVPAEELIPAGEDDAGSESGELMKKITEWIESLPVRQREAFELSRFEGLDHHEIAKVMDCAPRTVNNHIVSALGTLRDRLKEWEKKD